jgi:thioesterase domain-containing protein
MNNLEFQEFLHKQIPITEAMGFSVLVFSSSKIILKASLQPNINHKSTAFGGSINSLVTVCGWAMVFANIKEIDDAAHIVVQKSNISYLAPIDGDFYAECILEPSTTKERFFDTYKKHGKSRLRVEVLCYEGNKIAAKYEGHYVAFK